MGKLRQTALILGEGPTEFFYFKSLCDVFKRLTIKPDYPKHTNIKELEAKIAEGVAMGYSHIFCIIDMDTKDKEPERSQIPEAKGEVMPNLSATPSKVSTARSSSSRLTAAQNYSPFYFATPLVHTMNRSHLLKGLNQCVEYRKTIDFFIKTKGLHGYFERNGGSLEKAVVNAHQSMAEKQLSGRDYTYSELGRLMDDLKELE